MKRSLTMAVSAVMVLFFSAACSQKQTSGTSRTPEDIASLYLELGTSALMMEDLPRAIENLRMALKYDSKNHVVHNHLGLAYLGMGKSEDAKEELQKAISLKPSYSDAMVNLGTWYFFKNDLNMAKHYYQKSLENLEYRERYKPLTSIAQIHYLQGKPDEAKQLLFQAIHDNSEYCLAHLILGNVYQSQGEAARAAGEFKASIKGTCSNNIEGQYQLGVSYLGLKDYKKARTQFLQIMEQFPNTATADAASNHLRTIPENGY